MDNIDALSARLRQFSQEREWEEFHTPRNLVLALAGEVGELASLLQWIPDAEVEDALRSEVTREAFADELADCFAYLIQIAYEVGIDLVEVTQAKITKNALKYPVELSRGRSTKYTDLQQGD